jgi:hypothetical protein
MGGFGGASYALMAMQQTREDARTEGRTETRADDVLTVLRVRVRSPR